MEKSIEQSHEAINYSGEQREADGGIGSVTPIDGLGQLAITKEFYCHTGTFDLYVGVMVDEPESQLDLVLQPHGGPDPGSDEYTEKGVRFLEPDAEGNAEVALYDLPADVAFYELVDRADTLENPIMTFSGATVTAFCDEQIVQDPEYETDEPANKEPEPEPEPELGPKDPDEDILVNPDLPDQVREPESAPLPDEPQEFGSLEPEDPDQANEAPVEQDDTLVDEVDELVDTEAEEAAAEHTEQQQPEEDPAVIGGDTLLLAALGAAALFTGVATLRRRRQKV